MPNHEKLRQQLLQLDGHGYKAYQDILGNYRCGEDFVLWCDRIQGDPFASPSNFRVQVSGKVAGFPRQLYRTKSREIALKDYLTRQFDSLARRIGQRRGTGNSGLIASAKIGQEVLERTSVLINAQMVEVRFVVGLPAGGRRILGQQAVEMLLEDIPHLVDRTLKYSHLDAKAIQRHVETIEDADWMREKLAEKI